MASIAAAHLYGVSMEDIIKNIATYTGVHRRLEVKGYLNGAKIIDDYAHHPTEIKATLEAVKIHLMVAKSIVFFSLIPLLEQKYSLIVFLNPLSTQMKLL